MHDTIRLLEEKNRLLRLRLDLAIDMIVINHDCVLCPMSAECEHECKTQDDEEVVIECREKIKSFFESIDG